MLGVFRRPAGWQLDPKHTVSKALTFHPVFHGLAVLAQDSTPALAGCGHVWTFVNICCGF